MRLLLNLRKLMITMKVLLGFTTSFVCQFMSDLESLVRRFRAISYYSHSWNWFVYNEAFDSFRR